MNEKSLLSLREIARELNLKYKTILNFKNQLEPFLPGVFDGRNFKYFPDSKEILELIAALRGEGFTFSMIKEIFLENHKVENDPQMYEWVCECIGKHKHHWAQIDGSACASVDQSGSACASMDLHGSGCASTDQSEPIQASMDVNMPVYAGVDGDGFICTGMNEAGCGWTNPDQDKPDQTGTDQSKTRCSNPDKNVLEPANSDVTVQIQAGMDQVKQVCLKEVEALVMRFK